MSRVVLYKSSDSLKSSTLLKKPARRANESVVWFVCIPCSPVVPGGHCSGVLHVKCDTAECYLFQPGDHKMQSDKEFGLDEVFPLSHPEGYFTPCRSRSETEVPVFNLFASEYPGKHGLRGVFCPETLICAWECACRGLRATMCPTHLGMVVQRRMDSHAAHQQWPDWSCRKIASEQRLGGLVRVGLRVAQIFT